MAVLSEDDRGRLAEFFRRALELHAGGVVATDSAVEYFMLVVSAVDLHSRDAVAAMWAALEDAWRENDA